MRKLVVLLGLLCGCSLPLPLPGPLGVAPLPEPVHAVFCGMKVPDMYAAHRDSLDWRTYITATPRYVRGNTYALKLYSPGRFYVYRTGMLSE